MKYILTSSYCWSGLYGELDVRDFKEKYSDFKIQVSEKIKGYGNAVYYDVFIDVETLDELYKFINVAKYPIILGEDEIEYKGKKYPTIMIYDGYIE